mgnify:CR=1 FL=1
MLKYTWDFFSIKVVRQLWRSYNVVAKLAKSLPIYFIFHPHCVVYNYLRQYRKVLTSDYRGLYILEHNVLNLDGWIWYTG